MDAFTFELDFRDALALYIFLKGWEEELTGPAATLAERLRCYLYDRLSIEEMEKPEELLIRLGRSR